MVDNKRKLLVVLFDGHLTDFLLNDLYMFILRLPFDWRNPFGFSIAFAIQYATLLYATKIGVCALTLGIGSYILAIASSKCIKGSLFAIGRSIKAESDRSCILDQLIEFIDFHSRVKQLS